MSLQPAEARIGVLRGAQQEAPGSLRGLVRQLSIDQFENEGRRVMGARIGRRAAGGRPSLSATAWTPAASTRRAPAPAWALSPSVQRSRASALAWLSTLVPS